MCNILLLREEVGVLGLAVVLVLVVYYLEMHPL
jgi:hypothetical protein